MHALLIANPVSGQGRARRVLPLIERGLRGFIDDLKVVYCTCAPGDAAAKARKAASKGVNLVVVAAGDGTVREVIDGLLATDVPLAIIPLGTGNVLARELNLPLDSWRPGGLRKALEVIRMGRVRTVDVGRIRGLVPSNGQERHFVLMAGAGFDASVVARVKQPWKDRLGSWAYVFSVLESLFSIRPVRFSVTSPRGSFEGEAWAVIVGNSASYAWRLRLCPWARMDDGLLDVTVFRACNRSRFACMMVQAIWAGHETSPHVLHFTTPAVELRAEPPVPVQLDGDVIGRTPVSIEVMPAALRLIVPPFEETPRDGRQ